MPEHDWKELKSAVLGPERSAKVDAAVARELAAREVTERLKATYHDGDPVFIVMYETKGAASRGHASVFAVREHAERYLDKIALRVGGGGETELWRDPTSGCEYWIVAMGMTVEPTP